MTAAHKILILIALVGLVFGSSEPADELPKYDVRPHETDPNLIYVCELMQKIPRQRKEQLAVLEPLPSAQMLTANQPLQNFEREVPGQPETPNEPADNRSVIDDKSLEKNQIESAESMENQIDNRTASDASEIARQLDLTLGSAPQFDLTDESETAIKARSSDETEPFTEAISTNLQDQQKDKAARALLDQNKVGNRQSGILSSIFGKLNPNAAGSSANGASVSLVEDEAKLSKAFQEQQSLQKQITSSTESSPVNSSSDSTFSSTTTSPTPSSSSTTSTTTPQAPTTSTLSPDELEQEKIYKEFFGSRNAGNSNLNLLVNSILQRLGFGKHVPADVLKQNIQSELASLHATSTPAPALALPILATPILAPIAPIAAPALPAPSAAIAADYSASSSRSGHPYYVSYDEAKKYDPNDGQYAKKPADYVDPLKGQVNGPVEVAALVKYPAEPVKPKVKLDYNEYEKSDYRANDFRLGNITPFNRIPALSRYSNTVVSSVSKGFSNLYAGVKPLKSAYPLYGSNRN